MVLKSFPGRHFFFFCLCVVLVDLCKKLYDMPALLREALHHIDEVPPPVAQAVGHDGGELLRCVSREGIAHLDRGTEVLMSLCEKIGQVLPRMLLPGEEKGDLPLTGNGEHPRGEGA